MHALEILSGIHGFKFNLCLWIQWNSETKYMLHTRDKAYEMWCSANGKDVKVDNQVDLIAKKTWSSGKRFILSGGNLLGSYYLTASFGQEFFFLPDKFFISWLPHLSHMFFFFLYNVSPKENYLHQMELKPQLFAPTSIWQRWKWTSRLLPSFEIHITT